MTNGNNVLATIGDYDIVEFMVSEKYSNSAANREKHRAGEPRFSAKGNRALFVTMSVTPRKGANKSATFSGVSNIVTGA